MESSRRGSILTSRRQEIASQLQELILRTNSQIILYVKILDKPNEVFITAYTNYERDLLRELITNYQQYITTESAIECLIHLAKHNDRGLFEILIQIRKIALTESAIYNICEQCCEYDSHNVFAYMLEMKHVNLETLRKNNNKILCSACSNNSLEVFRQIISIQCDRADLMCRNNYPLLITCKNNSITIVRELFRIVKYTNLELNQNGMNVLLWVFFLGHREIINLLIEKKYITKQLLTLRDSQRLICIYIRNGNLETFIELLQIAEFIKLDNETKTYTPFDSNSTKKLFAMNSQILSNIIKYNKEPMLDFIFEVFTDLMKELFLMNRYRIFNDICSRNQYNMLIKIIDHFAIDDQTIMKSKMLLYAIANNSIEVLDFLLTKYKFAQSIITCVIDISVDNSEQFMNYPPFLFSISEEVHEVNDVKIAFNNDILVRSGKFNKYAFARNAFMIAADRGYYDSIMDALRILFPNRKINEDTQNSVYVNIKTVLENIIFTAINSGNFREADILLEYFSEYNLCSDKNMLCVDPLYDGIIKISE